MFNRFHENGVKAFSENKYEIAKDLFRQSTEKNPEVAESYLYLGKCYFFCDETIQAIAPLKKFIKLRKPNLAEVANVSYAYDLLGKCYEAANENTAALKYYDKAIKKYPSGASAWHNMGLLYIKSARHFLEKDLKKSVSLFNGAQFFILKALEICSANPFFLHTAASWYEQYLMVLERTTEDVASVEENIIHNFTTAIQYYRKALSACEEQDIVLKNIIFSNLTECTAQYGHHLYNNAKDCEVLESKYAKFSEAIEIYSEVLQLDPNHLIVINQIGMSLFNQGCFSEARNYFSSIFEKTDDKQEIADAWLNIACTYRLEKEWDKAEEALKQAKTFSPKEPLISDEEMKFIASKTAALLITTPQTWFSNSNPAPTHGVSRVLSLDTSQHRF